LRNQKKIYILLNDHTPNSASDIAYQIGYLKINITDNMLPDWSPVRLNSTSLYYIIPNLYNKYPDRKIMLENFATERPVFDFDKTGLAANLNVLQNWYVIIPEEKI